MYAFRKQLLLVAILFLISITSLFLAEKKHRDRQDTIQALVSAYTDTIQRFKKENGDNVARIQVIETEKAKDFLKVKSQDTLIQKLQASVKYYEKKLAHGGSVSNIGSTTTVTDTVPTVITKWETITDTVFPVYEFTSSDKWIKLSGKSSKLSTVFRLSVENNYTVAIGKEKDGTPFAEVTTDNPHTRVTTLKTYDVIIPKPRPKRIGIGVQAGYGFSTVTPHVYIGVGLSYNLILF